MGTGSRAWLPCRDHAARPAVPARRRSRRPSRHRGRRARPDAARLHERVLAWYDEHARDLPWREPTPTPWAVMVSEFMLQQTPVARVLPVYEQWLARWPTPADLAAEPAGEAVRAWGRLGYPRRALRLHAAARRDRRATTTGEVPPTYEELRALPASATTPRRRSRRSRSDSATSCSTPTSAGCWPGWSRRRSSPPGGDRGRADLADRPAARGRADRGRVGGRRDGARRAGLHRGIAAAAATARSPTCAAGGSAGSRPTTARRGGGRRTPAPTVSAGAGCWRCCATRRAGRARPPRAPPGRSPTSASAASRRWSRTACVVRSGRPGGSQRETPAGQPRFALP